MKTVFRLWIVLAVCGIAVAQQSYVKFEPSPGANPRWDTNLFNVVINNVTFHGKVTFMGSNTPSLWNTNGAGRYSPSDSFAQSLQFGSNAAAGGIHSIVLGSLNTNFDHSSVIGSTIGGGIRHYIASNAYSATVSGGTNNWIETNAFGSVISGGRNSIIRINATVGTIGGGDLHEIRAGSDFGTISGGTGGIIGAASDNATIGGGSGNAVSASQSTIGGGNANLIGTAATIATIAGGSTIQVDASQSTVGGGQGHLIRGGGSSAAATIGGGLNNTIGNGVSEGSIYSTIGGGNANTIRGQGAGNGANTIAGGQSQLIDQFSFYSSLGGGSGNTLLDSDYSTVAGGLNNRASSANYAAILGGTSNEVEVAFAVAIGNFVTNVTTKSVEIGPDNASKTRFDVNGVTALKLITATNGFASYSSNLLAVTSVALTGNPALWTNTLTKNVQAVWSGGTVSGVGVNASMWPTPAASGYVILQPGEWLAFTNTGVPEFAWKPL